IQSNFSFLINQLIPSITFEVYKLFQIFAVIFDIQLVFAGLGCIGLILDRISHPLKLFTLPYYFLLANLGLLIGFFRFLRGTQKAAWKATR
ncbi:MAG: hypothetical protein WCI84_09230, partial [Bacteroidota bacterium]